MKLLSIVVLLFLTITGWCQNMGVGTDTPAARLHVRSNFETLRLQGLSSYLSFYDHFGAYSAYIWNRNNNALDLGTAAGTFFPVTISPNNSVAATFSWSGNVGIGISNPLFKLDVNGRMRIGYNGESAGIWFGSSTGVTSPGFIGLYDDSHVGIYGNGSGWAFRANTTSGNVSIGSVAPTTSKLMVQSSGSNALEVAGGLKVSGPSPAAFRLTTSATNITNFGLTPNKAILIDHPLANDDPNALLFVTPVTYYPDIPFRVFYDQPIGRWKIIATASVVISGKASFGPVKGCNISDGCTAINHVALANFWDGFEPGHTFNILIIKQ